MDHFSATTSAPIPAPSLPLTDFDKALHGPPQKLPVMGIDNLGQYRHNVDVHTSALPCSGSWDPLVSGGWSPE
jgi:hypothetical protein